MRVAIYVSVAVLLGYWLTYLSQPRLPEGFQEQMVDLANATVSRAGLPLHPSAVCMPYDLEGAARVGEERIGHLRFRVPEAFAEVVSYYHQQLPESQWYDMKLAGVSGEYMTAAFLGKPGVRDGSVVQMTSWSRSPGETWVVYIVPVRSTGLAEEALPARGHGGGGQPR